MKIHVKGYLIFKNTIGDQILTLKNYENITLGELLTKLTFGNGSGDSLAPLEPRLVDPRVIVLINGRNITQLPNGMETQLADKDDIAIFPPMAGG
jgi:molybdopterin converting factor small subunit